MSTSSRSAAVGALTLGTAREVEEHSVGIGQRQGVGQQRSQEEEEAGVRQDAVRVGGCQRVEGILYLEAVQPNRSTGCSCASDDCRLRCNRRHRRGQLSSAKGVTEPTPCDSVAVRA